MSSAIRTKIKTLLLSVVQDEVVSIKNGLLLQQKLFYIYSSETKQRPKIELKNAKAQQKGAKSLRK